MHAVPATTHPKLYEQLLAARPQAVQTRGPSAAHRQSLRTVPSLYDQLLAARPVMSPSPCEGAKPALMSGDSRALYDQLLAARPKTASPAPQPLDTVSETTEIASETSEVAPLVEQSLQSTFEEYFEYAEAELLRYAEKKAAETKLSRRAEKTARKAPTVDLAPVSKSGTAYQERIPSPSSITTSFLTPCSIEAASPQTSAAHAESASPQTPIGTVILAKWSPTSRNWKKATVVAHEPDGAVVRFEGYSDTAAIPNERVRALPAELKAERVREHMKHPASAGAGEHSKQPSVTPTKKQHASDAATARSPTNPPRLPSSRRRDSGSLRCRGGSQGEAA